MISHHLRLIQWNANGVRHRRHELFHFLISNNINIACINETKLNPSLKFSHPHFYVIRFDDETGQISSGGVAIIIRRDKVKFERIQSIRTKILQTIGIAVSTNDTCINIVAAYLTGTTTNHNYELYREDLETLSQIENVVVLGDLNSRHQQWGCIGSNPAGKVLQEAAADGLFDVIFPNEPTYYPGLHANPSVIDLVLTNTQLHIADPVVIHDLGSDHFPLLIEVECTPIYTTPLEIPCISKANWGNFKGNVERRIDLQFFESPPISTNDIDERIAKLTEIVLDCQNRAIPKIKPKPTWDPIPPRVRNLIRQRNSLRRRYVRNGRNPHLRDEYNQIEKQVQIELDILHNQKFQREIAKINHGEDHNRKLFTLARNIKGGTMKINDLEVDWSIFTTDNDKARILASEFLSNHLTTHNDYSTEDTVVRKSISELAQQNVTALPQSPLFSVSQVRKELQRVKQRKAPGHDGIRNVAIRHAGSKLVKALTSIYNSCIRFTYFPFQWKQAVTIPIPKPGKPKSSPSSYRPISLLPVFGKILERLLMVPLKIYLEDSKSLPDFQFGFRSEHSTVQQIQRVVETVKNEFSNHHSTGMVLLDLKAAFDCVWHNAILHKMIMLGSPLHLVKMVQSFLSDRTFAVKVGSSLSDRIMIPAGVPQGAVMSPTLFNVYMNDIPIQIRVMIAQFADDVGSFASSRGPSWIKSRLKKFLDQFSTYCTKWKLKIQPLKTEAVYFTKKRSPTLLPSEGIPVQGHLIDWSPAAKYLGVYLDKSLTFEKHINYIVSRGSHAIRLLYPLLSRQSRLSSDNKILIFKAIIRPMITYACAVWGNCANIHMKRIQVIQNRCLKMALNLPMRYPTEDLHRRCKIDKIDEFVSRIRLRFQNRCRISENPLIRDLMQ